jgi:hypothetical protein
MTELTRAAGSIVNSASSAAFSCSKAAAAAASVSSSTLRIAACISSADKPPPDVTAVAVAVAVLVAPVCDHHRQWHEAYAVEGKEDKFALFSNRNGSLLRRQLRAMLSKSGTASLCNVSVSVILLCTLPGPGAQFDRPSRLLCESWCKDVTLCSESKARLCKQSCQFLQIIQEIETQRNFNTLPGLM